MSIDRRRFLHSGMGIGSVALSWLLARDQARADVLSPKAPHHAAKAKHCIFLLMEGGPSQIDTFDPKPKLDGLHMQEFAKDRTAFSAAMNTGRRYYVRSPFQFQPAGRLGIPVNTLFTQFSKVVDNVCFYRGLQVDSVNHPTALYHLNCGNQFGGDPAIGAWTSYGLGTENQNLPAFVVLPDVAYPQGGSANWSNGYLPAHFQGTALRSQGPPILDMAPPQEIRPEQQRANLELLHTLNRMHQQQNSGHAELSARIASYELAFRMQTAMPKVVDLSREPKETLELYGVGDPDKEVDAVARRCLLARRLVAAGVRFVQVIVGGWDSHDYIEKAHSARIRAIDKPIAGLLADLERTGLLEETLVVWAGEFGRSPDNGVRADGKAWGRDHNAKAMTVWLAGGGAPRGKIVGATDELGQTAAEVQRPLRDLHVTLLHLLGLDDRKLTYFHAGRNKQLSQTGGEVIRDLVG
jgi:hypothetical protein